MSSLGLFVTLLGLAYLGSILLDGRSLRGYGLPSGAEYLGLGLLAGPYGLGVISPEAISDLTPFLHAGSAWLLMLTGLTFGASGSRGSRLWGAFSSFLFAIVTLSLLYFSVRWVALRWTHLSPSEAHLLALSTGAVGMETTRIAVRWVVERYLASGPLCSKILTLADSDELPSLLLLSVLFVHLPLPEQVTPLSPPFWVPITLALGTSLGILCALLIRHSVGRKEEITISLLTGATLLAMGIATRLGLSGLTATFVLGLVTAWACPDRVKIRSILARTEQPVLLPVLLCAGAMLVFPSDTGGWLLIGAALLARVLGKTLSGLYLFATPSGRKAGPLLGLGLLSTGAVTISLALSIHLRVGGEVGEKVLCIAFFMTALGEWIGPTYLRLALLRAGECTPAVAPRGESPIGEAT